MWKRPAPRLTVDAAPVNQVGVGRPEGVVTPSTCRKHQRDKIIKEQTTSVGRKTNEFFFLQNEWRDQMEIFILARCYVAETLETLEACAVSPFPWERRSSSGFVRLTGLPTLCAARLQISLRATSMVQMVTIGNKNCQSFHRGAIKLSTLRHCSTQWPARFQFLIPDDVNFVQFFGHMDCIKSWDGFACSHWISTMTVFHKMKAMFLKC